MPPNAFQNVVVAMVGSLGDTWTETNVTRWVTRLGGKFSQEVNDSVTHLVCSLDEFKRQQQSRKITAALQRKCWVVTKDWLEDSLQKKRKLSKKRFDHKELQKQERKKKREKLKSENAERAKKRSEEQGEKFINKLRYLPYQDSTFFRYDVLITRKCDVEGERYRLVLYESVAKPPLYWFLARHYKSTHNTHPLPWRPSRTCQPFLVEFGHFKDFFYKKTGIEWDERLIKRGLDMGKWKFKYEPPGGGKPVGAIEDAANVPPEPDSPSPPATTDIIPAELRLSYRFDRDPSDQDGEILGTNVLDEEIEEDQSGFGKATCEVTSIRSVTQDECGFKQSQSMDMEMLDSGDIGA